MDATTFKQQQQDFLSQLWPARIVKLGQLQSVGDNVFTLDGHDIPCTETFTHDFDRLIGVGKRVRSMVKNTSGDAGLRNFRNYMNVAGDVNHATEAIIIASPQDHQLVAIQPIVDRYISPQLFFNFVEMVVEQTGYHIDSMKFRSHALPQITITFMSSNAPITSFGKGEEFITDGFYLDWDPQQVSLGHYYERLVCSNGQTVTEQHRDFASHNLDAHEMNRLISIVKQPSFVTRGLQHFATLINRAINSRISLAEMHKAHRALTDNNVDPITANGITHYHDAVADYKQNGIYDPKKEHLMIGPTTIWTTYNALTAFATHTSLWSPTDHRRITLQHAATTLLTKHPDINPYLNIYQ